MPKEQRRKVSQEGMEKIVLGQWVGVEKKNANTGKHAKPGGGREEKPCHDERGSITTLKVS